MSKKAFKIKVRKEVFLHYMGKRNLSLNQLSDELGVSPSTTCRILKHDIDPGALFIAHAISALNMSFEDLFYIENRSN
ncbi:helix-turn-helix transcriptional regulator [Bacillus subtilis]|nr:helix-turn-helix transcriptional regulator [Bacillus subtilis]MED3474672.1 helix-turn-helix transcriptional regulator [Bacillus subtilis]